MLGAGQKLINEFKDVRRKEGARTAVLLTAMMIKQDPNVIFSGTNKTTGSVIYHTKRTDNDDRWNMISSRIDPSASNAIDIGCNRGEITRRSANMGLFSVGVDIDKTNIQMARILENPRNCHFINQEITFEDTEKLPQFDVAFLLDVYYHWGNQYGWNEAEYMLQNVNNSTNQLFIETPGEFGKIRSDSLDTNLEAKTALKTYFQDILHESSVDFVGETEWSDNERTDFIYEIK